MTGAERVRRYRQRRNLGQICVPLVIDEARVADRLVERGYLHPSVADDRNAIARAAQRFLEDDAAPSLMILSPA
jgi:hypothetical protein